MKNELKLWELDEGGAVHWIVAYDEEEARGILKRDYFEITGIPDDEDEVFCAEFAREKLTVDTDVEGVMTKDADGWIEWAGKPSYLACSEF